MSDSADRIIIPLLLALLVVALIGFIGAAALRDGKDSDDVRTECAVSYQQAMDHNLTNLSRGAYIERCVNERG